MKGTITFKGLRTGSFFAIDPKMIGKGSMKNVYVTTDHKYVVGILKKDPDRNAIERLNDIIGPYRNSIYGSDGKDYWEKVMAWPVDIIRTTKGKYGVVMPFMPSRFKFSKGILKGKEKKGNWFVYKNALPMVDSSEAGNWKKFLDVSLHLSRTIRRIHAAGLCHSDLSFNNILVDPTSGFTHIIDLDNLVVPGKYPPDVMGTPGFIAPEVLKSVHMKEKKVLPSIETDLHALAVMIYMLLFKRHPLEGRKVWDNEAERDENLQKGAKAVFIEDSRTDINRIKNKNEYLPWSDTSGTPYTIAGPYLSSLFKRAFEQGLHMPSARPLASEWETALIKTQDIMVSCNNKNCNQKWFIFNKNGICPFCGHKLGHEWPVINIKKFDKKKQNYEFDNKQIIPFNGKRLYSWHYRTGVFLNEKLNPSDIQSGAYFQFYKGSWFLIPKMSSLIRLNGKQTDELKNKKYFPIHDKSEFYFGDGPHSKSLEVKFIKF